MASTTVDPQAEAAPAPSGKRAAPRRARPAGGPEPSAGALEAPEAACEAAPAGEGQGGDAECGARKAENPVQAALDALSERLRGCSAAMKECEGLLKDVWKVAKKHCKRRSISGRASNLTQPQQLSADLSAFVGEPPGALMTRGAVTKAVNEYAVSNGLKLPGNGRIIKVDARLAALMGKGVGDEVAIINVQSHLKHHYSKPEAA